MKCFAPSPIWLLFLSHTLRYDTGYMVYAVQSMYSVYCICFLYLLFGFVTRFQPRVCVRECACVFICVRKWTHEGLQMPSIKTQLRPLPSERGSGRGIEIWATHKYRILKSAHKFVFIAALISILIHRHVRVCECVQQTSCAYRTHAHSQHTRHVYFYVLAWKANVIILYTYNI